MSERVELDGLVEALVAFKGAYVTDDVGSVHRLARELIARHILRVIDEGIDRHDARAANARRNHLREKHAHKAAALVSLRARFEGADDEG